MIFILILNIVYLKYKDNRMPESNTVRILHTETHKLLIPLEKILFDITEYQWYSIYSGCATETCDARSRWSSMRGLHFFYTCFRKEILYGKKFSHLCATATYS